VSGRFAQRAQHKAYGFAAAQRTAASKSSRPEALRLPKVERNRALSGVNNFGNKMQPGEGEDDARMYAWAGGDRDALQTDSSIEARFAFVENL
jgi:hypothetical protein